MKENLSCHDDIGITHYSNERLGVKDSEYPSNFKFYDTDKEQKRKMHDIELSDTPKNVTIVGEIIPIFDASIHLGSLLTDKFNLIVVEGEDSVHVIYSGRLI